VDIHKNQISTSIGEIDYDYLVIATGSENNFYNFEPVKHKLLTLKSMPDALQIRNVIFKNLERALANNRREPLEEIMNIAIVGGGPAGMELSGALAVMRKHASRYEFPELQLSKMKGNVYQSGPVLLAGMSDQASARCLEYLRDLGVNVFLNARVKSYDNKAIVMEDGRR